MSSKEQEKKYTIDDLSELTGYSRRTIRYYIQEGLLDAPAGRGKGGFYFDSHLSQLQLIKQLQGRGMSLSAIFKYMERDQEPREQFNNEYIKPDWNPKMSEERFPAVKQRANMMKRKMDKISGEEMLQIDKKILYNKSFIPDRQFYALPPQSPRDVWVRYEVTPGLEINIRRDVEENQKRKIDDIIRIAREILGKDLR